jgi:predicted metalloprotease with PDZ domain
MNTINYQIALPQRRAHLIDVTITIAATDTPIDLQMPVWTPGSYLVREYARHVQSFAVSQAGQPCTWSKTDKTTWQIHPNHGDTPITVYYQVYGYELTVRTNHVDESHAFFNPAAVCMQQVGYTGGLAVQVITPIEWQVATQLEWHADPKSHDDTTAWSYHAVDYDQLYDSPFECGTHRLMRFFVDEIPHDVAIWGHGNEQIARLLADMERIVVATRQHFAQLPYQRYLFILHLADGMYGGLEHCNSTVCLCDRWGFAKPRDYERVLGLITHEFFHTWNVKRIRPAPLGPFDYAHENYTRQLWLAEGVTSYYDNLIMCRAGLLTTQRYLDVLAEDITSVQRTPGRHLQSLAEASFDAWIRYYRPDENSPNVSVSYYIKGAVVAFALDMTIRQWSNGTQSFDDVLRLLESRYPLYLPGIPEDNTMVQLISEVAGVDVAVVAEFFADYIYGTRELDWDAICATVGLRPRWHLGDEPAVTMGAKLRQDDTRLVIATLTPNGPAQRAGLAPFDQIVAVNYNRVDASRLKARLLEARPDSVIDVTYFRRDELRQCQVTLAATQPTALMLLSVATPSGSQAQQYQQWLAMPVRQE